MDTFTACELLDLFSKLLFEMAHNDLILMLMTDFHFVGFYLNFLVGIFDTYSMYAIV